MFRPQEYPLVGATSGGRRRRALNHRNSVESPHIGIAKSVGVGITRVNAVHHVLGQVPDAFLAAELGALKFDSRPIEIMIAALGIDDEKDDLACLYPDLQRIGPIDRNGLRTAGVNCP